MVMSGFRHLKLDFHNGVKPLYGVGVEVGGCFKGHFIGVGFQVSVRRQQVADTPVPIGDALAKSDPGARLVSLFQLDGQVFRRPAQGGIEHVGGDLAGAQTAPIGRWQQFLEPDQGDFMLFSHGDVYFFRSAVFEAVLQQAEHFVGRLSTRTDDKNKSKTVFIRLIGGRQGLDDFSGGFLHPSLLGAGHVLGGRKLFAQTFHFPDFGFVGKGF